MSGRIPEPDILADVNARIHDVAERSIARDDSWEFMCECGCEERVQLTLAEYEALAADGSPVLVDGHRRSESVRSHELREEAKALQAQAKHQIARARKNKNKPA